MYPKKKTITPKTLAPTIRAPPFNNLTNNLSLQQQQQQFFATQLFTDPLNETVRYKKNSEIITLL